MRIAVRSLIVLTLALLVGCLETTFVLGKVDDAKVDESLFGHWTFESFNGDPKDGATLDVARLDDHRYKLEWTTLSDGKVMKMAGFTAVVKGVLFVHAGQLKDDGTVASEHFVIRIDRDGADTINLSNLDPEFMKTQKADSDESLRTVIEANLDNPRMYITDVLVGKRATK
jgi:hypothetical protein